MMELTFETTEMSADGTVTTGTCTLNDIASWSTGTAPDSITSENQTEYVTVTADTLDGYNTTVQSRVLQKKLDEYAASGEMPESCSVTLGGETESTDYMVNEMVQWMALALPFVYLVMVAQFQSLLSPFIVLFTIPLAFTGGLLGLLLTGQQLTMISLMGFIVLMGTVVNNGIVFVDYANQLRMGGMERRAALVATGKTRMRPILMTTLTTVLAMLQMVFSNDMASQLMSGMAIVIICGLSYATLMTLYIVPILYDVLFKSRRSTWISAATMIWTTSRTMQPSSLRRRSLRHGTAGSLTIQKALHVLLGIFGGRIILEQSNAGRSADRPALCFHGKGRNGKRQLLLSAYRRRAARLKIGVTQKII